jgi:hypothetical protein
MIAMHEYALLTSHGVVASIVITNRPIDQIIADHPQFTVKPIEQVPQQAVLRYRRWGAER